MVPRLLIGERLKQGGTGNRKKEETEAVPIEVHERAGVPAPRDLFSVYVLISQLNLQSPNSLLANQRYEPARLLTRLSNLYKKGRHAFLLATVSWLLIGERLKQGGTGNRKKEEPEAVPIEVHERAGVPAPRDLFSGSPASEDMALYSGDVRWTRRKNKGTVGSPASEDMALVVVMSGGPEEKTREQ
ncbi:hypothetical protein NDU88_005328 [Pleurodeles waltl]|uniref:Uncharacterized protein n=1 Tax=Pleurodeles waltl TaxID=8319 RepID=A0AAV7VN78_PLEWA|nr:hypothetical protein NDU88_005328 [Pleurodeles waltl]